MLEQHLSFLNELHWILLSFRTLSFTVDRNMEDYITWVDSSKIRQHILKYNDELDDYDMLNS